MFVEHANEMEKKQLRVMKRVPDIDLTPFKDQILAENQSSMLSPAVPRMMAASSDAGAGAAAPLPAAPTLATPPVPSIKVGSEKPKKPFLTKKQKMIRCRFLVFIFRAWRRRLAEALQVSAPAAQTQFRQQTTCQ